MRNVAYSIAAIAAMLQFELEDMTSPHVIGWADVSRDQCEIPSPPPPPRHNSAIYNCPLLYRSSGAHSFVLRAQFLNKPNLNLI
jgi:hypothetical protein